MTSEYVTEGEKLESEASVCKGSARRGTGRCHQGPRQVPDQGKSQQRQVNALL